MFKTKNFSLKIEITLREALGSYRTEGLRLMGLLNEEVMQDTLTKIFLDDFYVIDTILPYVCERNNQSVTEVLEDMETPDLARFKEEFWEAVVNFSEARIKPMLRQTKKMFDEGVAKAFQKMNSSDSSLTTEEE